MNKGTKESVKSNIGGILPNTILSVKGFSEKGFNVSNSTGRFVHKSNIKSNNMSSLESVWVIEKNMNKSEKS